MKTPNVIYLQTCGTCEFDTIDVAECKECNFDPERMTFSTDRIYPSDKVYFSEKAVMELLRKEYEQANNLIDYASRLSKTIDGGLIDVAKSVIVAINNLKIKR